MKDNNAGASPPPELIKPTKLALSLMDTPAHEAQVRAMVVKEALSWRGTPYRQQGYTKGEKGAIDCSMLLVAAWVGSGLAEPFDPRPYPPAWFLHHSEERYLGWMETLATKVTTPQTADIVLFKFGRCFSHSAILTNNSGQLIHAAAYTGKCVMGSLDHPVLKNTGKSKERRPLVFFDVWAKMKSSVGK